jgi:hypothetical protein
MCRAMEGNLVGLRASRAWGEHEESIEGIEDGQI